MVAKAVFEGAKCGLLGLLNARKDGREFLLRTIDLAPNPLPLFKKLVHLSWRGADGRSF